MNGAVCSARVWAQRVFAGAELGDKRRSARLPRVAAALAANPHGTLPGTFSAWADLKAAYRLFAHADVTFAKISQPSWQRTRETCRRPGEYFLLEDSTELDFTAHTATTGLGQVGNERGQGLHLHTTLALRVAQWEAAHEPRVLVAGLLGQHCWTRSDAPERHRESKLKRLARTRESQRWAAVFTEHGGPPVGAQWTFIADREADIYEVFETCYRTGVDFIIRAAQPRALEQDDRSLFQAVACAPQQGTFTLVLRARPGQAARRAALGVRTTTVTLRPPQRPGGRAGPCLIHVVEARELNTPKGIEPIHWVLLTTWAVDTFALARRVINAYTQRWLIEEYHKALKSGAKIEHSQLSTASRLQALLGVLAAVAVRLLQTKLFATSIPEEHVPPQHLGPAALAILERRFGKPREGRTWRTLLGSMARLGGFLARKSDGDPGWLTIWRGWQQLMLMAEGYALAREGG